MLACVAPPVVYQIVRSLELFTTKVTSVAKLSLVYQLMFLERMFQFECHSTIFTCKVSDVRMNFQMDMICRYLIKCFATFFTTPAVSSNTMRSQVNVDTVSCLELLTTLFTTKWSL